ncbi:hypothetical protein [Ornithobacterium rhinotracheale]|uniref:hypothetical protein n=1 Tax=Ornithobacterium rhinotracheale TaxID=28251 RepID=UPI001FF338A0|nr:hypothetical protein [Ornithobacterium rhinotracheale]MCK0200463.1 hypothetical protein [Ornithobacterium rhinotracheale]
MKKLYFVTFLCLAILVSAQVPNFKLNAKIDKSILPRILSPKETCLYFFHDNGFSAYDDIYYCFFNSINGIELYKETRLKEYLNKEKKEKSKIEKIKIPESKKNELRGILRSSKLKNLLNYTQKDLDFKLSKGKPLPCMIADAPDYKIIVMQAGKQSAYHFYAPDYYLNQCNDKSIINEKVLKLFDALVTQLNLVYKEF